MDYLASFIELLAERSNSTNITGETELRSLGIDSLDLVEIVMEAEEKFDIAFSNDELNNFTTVNDVVNAIKAKK
jgi:acyl carrier protein